MAPDRKLLKDSVICRSGRRCHAIGFDVGQWEASIGGGVLRVKRKWRGVGEGMGIFSFFFLATGA